MADYRKTIEVQGEVIELLAGRSAFWKRSKTLMIADLHWGKAESFKSSGVYIPDGILRDDLKRLAKSIEATAAERILVLGDLVHDSKKLPLEVSNEVALWRAKFSMPFTLVRGNHDRSLKNLPEDWNIQIEETLIEPPFQFVHAPKSHASYFSWCGHIHPTYRFGAAREVLRLPCFHIQKKLGILPAFSFFTGGFNIERVATDRVFAIAEETIIEL